MSQTTSPNAASQGKNGRAGSLPRQEDTQPEQKIWWWYRLTLPPEVPGYLDLTFAQRESTRRARLLSAISFFVLLVDLLLIPASLFTANRYVPYVCSFALVAIIISIIANRTNNVTFASFLLVGALELALLSIVVTTIPFDVGNLPLYDLLIIVELFAASLLPAPYIFLTALFNSLFVITEVLLQKMSAGLATPALYAYLQNPFHAVLVRPVALQIVVGVMSFLWVRSTSQAIVRADRAEMVAQLEHELAQQKEELEEGIRQLLQTHIDVSNGNFDARTPLTRDHTLWPLANALNTLLTRFQRASKAEQEIQRFQKMIPVLFNAIQAAEQSGKPLPIFPRTSSPIDPLLSCLCGRKITMPHPPDASFRN